MRDQEDRYAGLEQQGLDQAFTTLHGAMFSHSNRVECQPMGIIS